MPRRPGTTTGSPAAARPSLEPFLKEVEQFATADYAAALQAGSELDPARRQAVAERLAHYTGLPVAYVLKADLRIDGGMFEKTLQDAERPDHRAASTPASPAPTSTPCARKPTTTRSRRRSARPMSRPSTTMPARRSAMARAAPSSPRSTSSALELRAPAARAPISRFPASLNVMPDLAFAMKYNPN